jgi:hypothetical protein
MSTLFFLLFLCLIGGSFTGYLAAKKGYSYSIWFCLGFLFNLIALIVAAGLPVNKDFQAKDKKDALNNCEICGKPTLWNYGEKTGMICKKCATKE